MPTQLKHTFILLMNLTPKYMKDYLVNYLGNSLKWIRNIQSDQDSFFFNQQISNIFSYKETAFYISFIDIMK